MYCGKCGSKLENDATFCPYCGNKIDKNKDTLPKEEGKKNISEGEKNTLENTSNAQPIEELDNFEITNNTPNKQNVVANGNDSLKNTSFVLGLISIIFAFYNILVIPVAIVGICTGAKYKSNEKKGCPGFVLSIIGLVLSFIILVGLISLIVFAVMDMDDNDIQPRIEDTNIVDSDDDYYDERGMQVIGNEKFGYLRISNDWILYKDSDGSSALQYSIDRKWVLSLYAIDSPNYTIGEYANSIYSKMEGYGATNIKVESVRVGKYQATKQSAYLSSISSYMCTWCFADEYGNYHYIAINGPSMYSSNFDVVDTFTLTK